MQGDIGRYTSASSCGALPSSGGINSGDTSVVGGLVGGRSNGLCALVITPLVEPLACGEG